MKNVNVGGVMMVGFGVGHYAAGIDGHRVVVERQETHYGDKGWMALVDDRAVTDYPRRTRAEALAVAIATINSEVR